MAGKTPGAGRKKGVPNKITTDLKEMILGALNAAGGKGGGQEYLKKQALEHPGPFMALVGKVLPLQVTGKDGGAIEFTAVIRKIVHEQPGNGAEKVE